MPRPRPRRPPPSSPLASIGCALIISAALLVVRAFWLGRGLLGDLLRALWIEHQGWIAVLLVVGGIGLMIAARRIE